MRSQPGRWLVSTFALGSVALLGASAARADEAAERTEMARRIRAALAALEEVRGERLAIEREGAARLAALDDGIARLERQRDDLRAEVGRSAAAAAAAEAEQARVDEARAVLTSALAEVRAALARQSEAAAVLARTGIPFRRDERAAAFDDLARALASGPPPADGAPSPSAPSPSAPWSAGSAGSAALLAEASAALLQRLVEEARLGRSCELWNEPVAVDGGREVHADHIRVGLLGHAFVSEDGAHAGLARPGTGGWDLLGEDERRDAVERALLVLHRRRPPGVGGFPLPLGPGTPAAEPAARSPGAAPPVPGAPPSGRP